MDNAIIPSRAQVPIFILGERQRFPNHPPARPAAQGVVPAFHVGGFIGLLADTLVPRFRKDTGVSLPEVAEGAATAVSVGYLPKLPAGRLGLIAVDVYPEGTRVTTCRILRYL